MRRMVHARAAAPLAFAALDARVMDRACVHASRLSPARSLSPRLSPSGIRRRAARSRRPTAAPSRKLDPSRRAAAGAPRAALNAGRRCRRLRRRRGAPPGTLPPAFGRPRRTMRSRWPADCARRPTGAASIWPRAPATATRSTSRLLASERARRTPSERRGRRRAYGRPADRRSSTSTRPRTSSRRFPASGTRSPQRIVEIRERDGPSHRSTSCSTSRE